MAVAVGRNGNQISSGKYAFLMTGRLPSGAAYIRRMMSAMRKALEAAVQERHGDVSVYHDCVILSAIRHETRCQLAQRWLRAKAATMSPEQLLAFNREIGSATDARDRCLRALGIDQTTKRGIAEILYGQQRRPPVVNGSGAQAPASDAGETH